MLCRFNIYRRRMCGMFIFITTGYVFLPLCEIESQKRSTRKFNTMLPSIKIRPLNILSASSVNLHGITNSNVFHNNLRIRLSPLKSPILRKYTNPFKRCGMYPSISKCNAKRCKCCKHLSTKSTVTSSVNGRQFSIINNSDLD